MAQEANLVTGDPRRTQTGGPSSRPNTARRERIVVRGVRVTEPDLYRRAVRRAWLTFSGIAAALLKATSLATSWSLHLAVLLFLMAFFTISPPEKEPLTIALGGQSLTGLTVPLVGPETETERVQTKEAPDEVEEAPEPVQDPTPAPAEPRPEPQPRNEVVEEPMRGEDAIDPRAAYEGEREITSETVTAYVEQAIGAGAQGSPPPALPRDAGRAIAENPTQAVRALRAQDLGSLARGRPQEIIVVLGRYDGVERILGALNIPHRAINFSRLVTYDLGECRVLIFNCADELARGRLTVRRESSREIERLERDIRELEEDLREEGDPRVRAALEQGLSGLRRMLEEAQAQDEQTNQGARVLQKVRRFVEGGGYLLTTDWGLTVLEETFRGYVSYRSEAREGRTAIEPYPSAQTHELLRRSLLDEGSTHARPRRGLAWQVDGGSYYFTFDASRTQGLVRGSDLPAGRETVAVVFRPAGDGHPAPGMILHTLGHFREQADRYGHFTLQNLLLNFLLDAFGQ